MRDPLPEAHGEAELVGAIGDDHGIAVVGVGNPSRGDDAVGLLVAQVVERQAPADVAVLTSEGDASEIDDILTRYRVVIIVDAVESGAKPGHIHRFNAHNTPLPVDVRLNSTRGFGVAEGIELLRRLDRLPSVVLVYGVEGARFGLGAPLHKSVSRAVSLVVKRILDDPCELEACRDQDCTRPD